MSKEIIETFYSAFQALDAKKMGALYHDDASFSDPAFQKLSAEETRAMWKMLIDRSKGDLKISFHSVIADHENGSCIWEAEYPFSKTGNSVHNIIHTSMVFKEGRILKHTDHFSFWRWSSMALGLPGRLFGWSPYLKRKVREMAMKSLRDYMSSTNS